MSQWVLNSLTKFKKNNKYLKGHWKNRHMMRSFKAKKKMNKINQLQQPILFIKNMKKKPIFSTKHFLSKFQMSPILRFLAKLRISRRILFSVQKIRTPCFQALSWRNLQLILQKLTIKIQKNRVRKNKSLNNRKLMKLEFWEYK